MSYKQIYEIEIKHDGLNKYRLIRGTNLYVVQQKAAAQKLQWDEMWRKKSEAERKRVQLSQTFQNKQAKKDSAIERSYAAKKAIEEIRFC